MLPRIFVVILLIQSIRSQLNLIGLEIPYTDKIIKVIAPEKKCEPSVTMYTNGEHPCKKALLFEDHFDGSFLNQKKWTVEKYTPIVSGAPDYEFVSYEANDDTLFLNNSKLIINPVPVNNQDQVRGVLDLLEGCTSVIEDQCYYQQLGANILPPVKSAEISTKFSFTYGRIEVKAKLPLGDWIYPKIQLVPRRPTKDGAKMWVAYSRGNSYYIGPTGDVGSTALFGGLVLGAEEPGRSRFTSKLRSVNRYGEDVYTFGLMWEPGQVTVSLNNKTYGVYSVDQSSGRFVSFANEFQLTIGIGVGGVNDFPDNYTSNNPKPWTNMESKQLSKFFNARNTWLPTWKKHNVELQIDSVKIWAL